MPASPNSASGLSRASPKAPWCTKLASIHPDFAIDGSISV